MRRGVWTAKSVPVTCGATGHDVPALEPVWEKVRDNGTAVYRCTDHAPAHAPVDFDAVHRAMEAIETRRSGQESGQTTRVGNPSAPVMDGFVQAASIPVFDLGQAASRERPQPGPKPFHEVADDPVIARLCAEDNR